MTMANGVGKQRLIVAGLGLNTGLILTVLAWLGAVSYNAGQHARQIDINTAVIADIQKKVDRIDREGSTHSSTQLQEVLRRLGEIEEILQNHRRAMGEIK
jgi:hypothetical protein